MIITALVDSGAKLSFFFFFLFYSVRQEMKFELRLSIIQLNTREENDQHTKYYNMDRVLDKLNRKR